MDVKSEINHLSGTQKELLIEAPAEVVQQEFEKTYTAWGRSAKVAGFRPGKAPRSVIKQKFQQEVREAVVSQLVPTLIQTVLDEHHLHLVTDPKISELSVQEGQPLKFKAVVEVFPQFEMTNYKGLRVKKKVRAVTAAEIDQTLEQLRQHHAQLIPVEDRPAEVGDFATLHLSARLVSPPAESEASLFTDQIAEIEIGTEDVLPAFTDNLKGMQVGETRTFRVTYPDDQNTSRVAGQEIEYDAKLEALRIKELSELDDEFPRSIGEECETLAEFRQILEQRRQQSHEEEAEEGFPDAVLAQLIESHPIDVPDTMIRRQLESRLRKIARAAISQGVDPRSPDIDWENIARQERDKAIQDIRGAFVLQKIAEQEALNVSNAELDAEIAQLAAQQRESPLRLRERLTKEGALDTMRIEMKNRKALELVVQAATVEREVIDGGS